MLKLVSEAYLEGFYYRARTDKTSLAKCSKGLIALSGCLKGEISKALASHDDARAESLVRDYQRVFGAESFFLELIHHPESPTQNEVNEKLIELSKRTGAPLVAVHDRHYPYPYDREAQDRLQCLHDGALLEDPNRHSRAGMDHAMSAPLEMIAAFSHVPGSDRQYAAHRGQVLRHAGTWAKSFAVFQRPGS